MKGKEKKKNLAVLFMFVFQNYKIRKEEKKKRRKEEKKKEEEGQRRRRRREQRRRRGQRRFVWLVLWKIVGK